MRWSFLTSIDEMKVNEYARGTATFPEDTWFFRDHFPGFPVVPGVIMLEALAQLSGKLIGWSVKRVRGDWPFPIISMANNVKFRRFIRPGELVVLETRVQHLREDSCLVRVKASVDGKMTTQAEETFVFNAVKLDSEAEAQRVERLESAELARLWAGYSHEQ